MKHIADRLEIALGNNNSDELIPEAISMLRQQQAEIESFKKEVANEHYCLVWEDSCGKLKVVDICPPPEGSIKLYTHSVKELTIQEVGLLTTDPRFSHIESPLLLEFYQACFKKARER